MTLFKSSVLVFVLLCAVGCASQSSVLVSGAQPGQYVSKTLSFAKTPSDRRPHRR
jgi:hypothetical protein